MRIAIFEDDQSQAELLGHLLRVVGHQTLAFAHSADFLNALQRESVDAVTPGLRRVGKRPRSYPTLQIGATAQLLSCVGAPVERAP